MSDLEMILPVVYRSNQNTVGLLQRFDKIIGALESLSSKGIALEDQVLEANEHLPTYDFLQTMVEASENLLDRFPGIQQDLEQLRLDLTTNTDLLTEVEMPEYFAGVEDLQLTLVQIYRRIADLYETMTSTAVNTRLLLTLMVEDRTQMDQAP